MTGISVLASAFGLLLGAAEAKRSDSMGLVEYQAPADSGLSLVFRNRQSDAGVRRSEAEKKELDKVTGTWVQTGEGVPPENAKVRSHL